MGAKDGCCCHAEQVCGEGDGECVWVGGCECVERVMVSVCGCEGVSIVCGLAYVCVCAWVCMCVGVYACMYMYIYVLHVGWSACAYTCTCNVSARVCIQPSHSPLLTRSQNKCSPYWPQDDQRLQFGHFQLESLGAEDEPSYRLSHLKLENLEVCANIYLHVSTPEILPISSVGERLKEHVYMCMCRQS